MKDTTRKNKFIKRRYVVSGVTMSTEEGYFINTGIWADGHLAYSRCDKDGNIIKDEEGCYYQILALVGNGNKYSRRLCMFHV